VDKVTLLATMGLTGYPVNNNTRNAISCQGRTSQYKSKLWYSESLNWSFYGFM